MITQEKAEGYEGMKNGTASIANVTMLTNSQVTFAVVGFTKVTILHDVTVRENV